jgi:hypothetical protein
MQSFARKRSPSPVECVTRKSKQFPNRGTGSEYVTDILNERRYDRLDASITGSHKAGEVSAESPKVSFGFA